MPADKLPPIPNDPAHPLRRFVFRWIYGSHLDAKTWYGETHRDELHRLTRITRWPRRQAKHNRSNPSTVPMGRRYRFDGDTEELTYEEMIERLRQRCAPDDDQARFIGRVQDHPVVKAWQQDRREIPFAPSEPAFKPGTEVVRNFADIDDPDLRARLLAKRNRRGGMRGIVKEGNALYVLVDFAGKTGEQWVAAWKLDAWGRMAGPTNAEAI